MDLELFDKIIPSESSVTYLSTKVEVKLKKASTVKWAHLEHVQQPTVVQDQPPRISSLRLKRIHRSVQLLRRLLLRPII